MATDMLPWFSLLDYLQSLGVTIKPYPERSLAKDGYMALLLDGNYVSSYSTKPFEGQLSMSIGVGLAVDSRPYSCSQACWAPEILRLMGLPEPPTDEYITLRLNHDYGWELDVSGSKLRKDTSDEIFIIYRPPENDRGNKETWKAEGNPIFPKGSGIAQTLVPILRACFEEFVRSE